MKKKYTILKSIALGALVVSTSIFAHAQSPRKVLIEEGTNSYCGPCAAQNPSFQEWVISKMPNLIPVTFHTSWPGSADPMYQHNTGMPNSRVQYYGFSGVPSAMINGKIYTASQGWYDGAPGDLETMESGYNTEIAKKQGISPITMKVTQKVEGGNLKVDVDVSTIEALSGVKLRVYVVQENVHDPAAGSNGEVDFPWVARTMLPSVDGTALDLAAGASKVVPLSVPVNSAWDMSQIYIVAFVQNDANKEVLQATSNYINPTTEISAPKAAVLKAPMEGENFSVAIKNTSENDITYQWTLTKSDRTPSDWDASLIDASDDIQVKAGETADMTVRLVPGATAGIGDAVFTLSPKDNPDQRIYTHQVTVMSSNVEKLNVMAETAADVGVVSSLLTETGHESYIDVTDRDLENLYKDILLNNNIKYIVWNGGKAGGITRTGGIALASLLQSGVGVLITGQVSIPLLTSDPSNVLLSTLGVNWDGNSGNISSTQNGTFKLLGVADDIITDGMSMTGKRVSYVMQELLINGDNTTPILRLQSPNRDIAAKTQLDKARAVVLAFHPDVIQDAAQRKTLIDRSLDWIEGFTAAPTPHAILNFEPEQPIDFGKVMVGKEKEITLEIRAANSAGLEISEISEFSDGLFDKYGISIVGLPSTFPDEVITLTEGQKFSFKLRFAPTEVGEISTNGEEARLSLWTNAEGGVYTIDITGEATENTTSVGETVSRNGEFAVSAGPNPFAGSSVVRYSLNSNTAKNVRIALFNEQGREVAVLVNNVVMPGDHTAALDGSNLSAGMYRVVMTVDGETVSLPVVSVK